MLNKRKSVSEFKQKSFKEYETILLGDSNVGKTTYMTKLIQQECKLNTPQSISDDQNLFEFLFEFNDNKAIFILKDTASK
jgi:GTPase SAR1 family protein